MVKIGLALVVLLGGAYFLLPQFRPVIIGLAPLALFALCPLSMFFMMATMHRGHDRAEKLFACPECGFAYREPEWAKKCAAWCKEHHSCNLVITAHAVPREEVDK